MPLERITLMICMQGMLKNVKPIYLIVSLLINFQ